MRIEQASNFRLKEVDDRTVFLSGEDGSLFSVSALHKEIFRVCHRRKGSAQMPETWMVTGADGSVPLTGRARDDLSRFEPVESEMIVENDRFSIKTEALSVSSRISSPCLRWQDQFDRVLDEDLEELSYAYDGESNHIYHYMKRDRSMLYFGLGEKSGHLNKHGRRYRMFNLDAGRYNAEFSDPLYKHIPFYICFDPVTGLAWGLLYDNLATTTFDLGAEHHNFFPSYRYSFAEDGDLDYYFILGPDLKGVVEKLAWLTGYITLPPRYTLGYLGSTMHYTEAENAQEELAKFPALCNEHDIPCDLFHLSSGYSKHGDGKRYVFEWNLDRVPEPESMCDNFHEHGIKLTANVKPCLLTSHPQYKVVENFSGFVQEKEEDGDGSEDRQRPRIDRFWDGDGSHLDFTKYDTINWWKSKVKEELLARGVDAIWNDNNEYAIFDDRSRVGGFGSGYDLSLIGRPTQTLLMAWASYSALSEFFPDKRPYLITRSGCPGIQRYAQTWTGDNDCNWHTLKFNIPMGLGLSLSGMPNFGHDVGGFFGDKPDPELFVRWIQNGIFHPRFTIHSWHDDGSVNEPWMYPEQLDTVRELIRFRYRIIPYLYSLLVEAAQKGHPIVRPLVYEFPFDRNCHSQSFDFLLGSHWLVASVFEPGARTRDVYLPEGSNWCEFDTGNWHPGGSQCSLEAPLNRIPTLVREGGLIPLGSARAVEMLEREGDRLRQVMAFPHQHSGKASFILHEDDGVTLAYQRGERSSFNLSMESDPETITIGIEYIENGYRPAYEEIEWIFPGGESRKIKGADRVYLGEDGKLRGITKLKF